MSMRMWKIYGYGINDDDLNPSTDKQIEFIKKYIPEAFKDMPQGGDTHDIQEWIDKFEDNYGYTGFPALFALAIANNEPDFNVAYYSCDGYGAIMYEDRQPFDMTERERHMTQDDMDTIFLRYINDLSVDARPGRVSVEFYG